MLRTNERKHSNTSGEAKSYICIDLKSFFASVECVERGLDPMTTNLVVADPDRTEKTICLAITPAMKRLGIRNRCRVYEIPPNVSYIMAEPRMSLYMEYSTMIYKIYLKFVSSEDIHVYSVDEVFIDVTHYLKLYGKTAKELGKTMIDKVFRETGITATCGVGTNMFLAKIAMDIIAKHAPDFMGELDEESFKEVLWDHKPLQDFWMIGPATTKKLEKYGITTMRELAHTDEAFLYKQFGVDAELLIDHAWGREFTEMKDVKAYVPKDNSLSRSQILPCNYSFEEGKLILKEMMDLLCLEMVDRDFVTDSVTIHINYSRECQAEPAHGSVHLDFRTSADRIIIPAVTELYKQIVSRELPIRRVSISCNKIVHEAYMQYDIFTDAEALEKDKHIQMAVLDIKKKYGKNAILKGMNFEEKATTKERNIQIGGHKGYGEGKTVYVKGDES